MKLKNHLEKLEILRLWLQDNVDMESELEFTDGVTSEDMLPVIQAVESLFEMPKAVRQVPPHSEYFSAAGVVDEMNRAESQIWNRARDYVQDKLKGKS